MVPENTTDLFSTGAILNMIHQHRLHLVLWLCVQFRCGLDVVCKSEVLVLLHDTWKICITFTAKAICFFALRSTSVADHIRPGLPLWSPCKTDKASFLTYHSGHTFQVSWKKQRPMRFATYDQQPTQAFHQVVHTHCRTDHPKQIVPSVCTVFGRRVD
jgi:hypothetical protein